MNTVRRYEAGDRSRVEEICRTAFRLTSFHSDPAFPRSAADAAVWELYGRPAVDSRSSPCFVAELDGRLAGFFIYGGYANLSRTFGFRVSNIVLLAVDPGFQGHGIGRSLLEAGMRHLLDQGSRLITVGTDSNNHAALHLYKGAGFQPVLKWSTWRLWNPVLFPLNLSPHEVLIPPGPGKLALSSFLEDPLMTGEQIRIVRRHLDRPPAPDARTCFQEGRIRVYEQQSLLSQLCGLEFLRLTALHEPAETSASQASDASFQVPGSSDKSCVEVFVKSGSSLETGLRSAGFSPVHSAVTLHYRARQADSLN